MEVTYQGLDANGEADATGAVDITVFTVDQGKEFELRHLSIGPENPQDGDITGRAYLFIGSRFIDFAGGLAPGILPDRGYWSDRVLIAKAQSTIVFKCRGFAAGQKLIVAGFGWLCVR